MWWRAAARRLSHRAAGQLERATAIGISTISIWELARLERAGRMRLDRSIERWVTAALADTRVEVLPVTREIALTGAAHAGVLPDPADQLIYATALEHGATLVSRDGALRDLDARRVVW